MKCVICKHGETGPGKASIVFDRDGATLVIRGVPAQVCRNCGEEYVDDATARLLLKEAEAQARAGVTVDIREYAAV